MDNFQSEINNLDKLQLGDHTVLLYEQRNEDIFAAAAYVSASIKKGEKSIYIRGDEDKKLLIEELEKAVDNFEERISRGNLEILETAETYASGSNFDSEEMIKLIKKKSLEAVENGYSGLSITGELSDILKCEGSRREIIKYEWKLNDEVFNEYPVSALCRYNINKFEDEVIKAVIEIHHYILWKGQLNENPYFIEPEGYRNNQVVKYEIESWLKNILKYKNKESVFKKKLEKTEAKYEELFNTAPIGIIRTTSQGKVLTVNKKMAELGGFRSTAEAIEAYNDLGREFYVNSERRTELIKELKKNNSVKNFEFKAYKKNGEEIWLNMNAAIGEKNNSNNFIIEGYVNDITERKNAQADLERKKEELNASNQQLAAYNEEVIAMNEELEQSFSELQEMNTRFENMIDIVSDIEDMALLNEEDFLANLLDTAINVVPEADHGSVYTYKDGKVNFVYTIDYNLEDMKELDIPAEAFYNKKDIIEIVSLDGLKNKNKNFIDEKSSKILNNKTYNKIKEAMCLDLEINGVKKAGLSLDIDVESNQAFSEVSLNAFNAFYNIASSFYKIQEYNYLQRNFTRELITAIIKILEMYDYYTKGHSQNVANLATAIAKEMRLNKEQVQAAYWAGMVHDIGKLLIPLDIINKNGKLTEREYDLIKKHPVLGYRALSISDSLKKVSKYVLHHHERWDGRGYPDGLKGNQIPLIAQILQLADSWDAMRSKRAYRDPLSRDEAIKEVIKNIGSQFSPEVAKIFLKMQDIELEEENILAAE